MRDSVKMHAQRVSATTPPAIRAASADQHSCILEVGGGIEHSRLQLSVRACALPHDLCKVGSKFPDVVLEVSSCTAAE